jgi:GAF domain-containing protein
LLLYDEAGGQLVTVATTGSNVPLQQIALDLIRRNMDIDPLSLSYPPHINRSVTDAFVGHRTQVDSMADAFENIFPPSVAPLAHGLVGITTVVSCPVVAEGRGLGLIRFLVPAPPTDPQLALMEAAANQIGLILLNAELAEQMSRQLAATRAIGEVVRSTRALGSEATLKALADKVRELTDADLAVVYLANAEGTGYRVAAVTLSEAGRIAELGPTIAEREIGRGLIGWVIASGEAAFIPDVRRDPRSGSPRSYRVDEAVIAAPMRTPDRAVGCLRVSLTAGRRFTEPDLWVTQAMADQAALIVPDPEDEDRGRAMKADKRSKQRASVPSIDVT